MPKFVNSISYEKQILQYIFTSEKDGLGKSFRFSKIAFMSVGVLMSAMIILAYVGFTRIVGLDAITYELDQLRKYKYITNNLLIESGSKTTTIDSKDMEEIIINYIIANDMIIHHQHQSIAIF